MEDGQWTPERLRKTRQDIMIDADDMATAAGLRKIATDAAQDVLYLRKSIRDTQKRLEAAEDFALEADRIALKAELKDAASKETA